MYHHHIIPYHIIDLKRQNRLKVGTNKPRLKVQMQSVSDDDVRKKTSCVSVSSEIRRRRFSHRPYFGSDALELTPFEPAKVKT